LALVKKGCRNHSLAKYKYAFVHHAFENGYSMNEIGKHISISGVAVGKILSKLDSYMPGTFKEVIDINNSVPIEVPMVTAAPFPNLYVTGWSLINLAIIIGVAVLVFRYFKQKNNFRKQVLNKLDSLIALFQHCKNDE
jgi:hypothetical protein